MSEVDRTEERLATGLDALRRLRGEVERVFLGGRDAVDLLLWSLLAEGHVLIESAPGLGKTTLVRGLARALRLDFHRIQFTPDLMPGDVLGTRVLEEDADGHRRFVQHRGPIFTHVLLADEVNRATPRTQAALLEAMQERQVTLFGETWPLDRPFQVIATQNPIEMEGTYPLPEAQLDRFVAKIELDGPERDDLVAVLEATTASERATVEPVLERDRLLELCDLTRQVEASSDVVRGVAELVLATDPRRPDAPEVVRSCLRYGSSPRGGQAVLLLAKARALCAGRLHVSPEDARAVARPALRHRLILSYEGEARELHPDRAIDAALERSSLSR